jgi:hypothetical protein
MAQENRNEHIPPRLHFRFSYEDGRVNALCVWPDGEWKVEIFASKEHALKFAKQHNMEIHDHEIDSSS